MAQHVKVLGILHIIYGALGVFVGLLVFLIMGGIAGLVGVTDHSPDSAVGTLNSAASTRADANWDSSGPSAANDIT